MTLYAANKLIDYAVRLEMTKVENTETTLIAAIRFCANLRR